MRLRKDTLCCNVEAMVQSTITEKFQTTIPLEVRRAMKLAPRQKVTYQLRPDGSVIMRRVLGLNELIGSLKPDRPVGTIAEEKEAAAAAWAREAAEEGLP
ncbi:hypothetical protein DB346_18405 [Verrucomicrobia bacterium LW23]|nr:hypothetical protein DB346_18405 [Verrucomicrobia bacterium LW23]